MILTIFGYSYKCSYATGLVVHGHIWIIYMQDLTDKPDDGVKVVTKIMGLLTALGPSNRSYFSPIATVLNGVQQGVDENRQKKRERKRETVAKGRI